MTGISDYSILVVDKKPIIFGGRGSLSTIVQYDPTQDNWTKLGNLNFKRYTHRAIQVDNEFLVVGGILIDSMGSTDPMAPTESCKLNGQSMKCITRDPLLEHFGHLELVLVP